MMEWFEEENATTMNTNKMDDAVIPTLGFFQSTVIQSSLHDRDKGRTNRISKQRKHGNRLKARQRSLRIAKPRRRISDFMVGTWVKGRVSNVVLYGAFIDIGYKKDVLCHISKISQGFVATVANHMRVGDEVEVIIIEIDKNRGRIDVSLLSPKQDISINAANSIPLSCGTAL
jgi:transcriptional accessory protein Tex/SPT6